MKTEKKHKNKGVNIFRYHQYLADKSVLSNPTIGNGLRTYIFNYFCILTSRVISL